MSDFISGFNKVFQGDSSPVQLPKDATLEGLPEGLLTQVDRLPGDSTQGEKIGKMFGEAVKGTGTAVGVSVATIGKLTGGAISGVVGLTAGAAGMLGAGLGWIASGATGGDKYARKEAALKGAQLSIPVAIGVGAALTPINVPIKFVEKFGKALIPKGTEPEAYKKLNDSYKTHMLPFCISVGKNAVQEQRKGFQFEHTVLNQAFKKLIGTQEKAAATVSKEQIKALKTETTSSEKISEKVNSEIDDLQEDLEKGENVIENKNVMALKDDGKVMFQGHKFGTINVSSRKIEIDKEWLTTTKRGETEFMNEAIKKFYEFALKQFENEKRPPYIELKNNDFEEAFGFTYFLNGEGKLEMTEDADKIRDLRKNGTRIESR